MPVMVSKSGSGRAPSRLITANAAPAMTASPQPSSAAAGAMPAGGVPMNRTSPTAVQPRAATSRGRSRWRPVARSTVRTNTGADPIATSVAIETPTTPTALKKASW